MSELSREEQEYYDRCVTIHNELSNTKLLESLIDLREQTINRVARLDNEKLVWKELGKLYILDVLVGKKERVIQEIRRLEEHMKEENQ